MPHRLRTSCGAKHKEVLVSASPSTTERQSPSQPPTPASGGPATAILRTVDLTKDFRGFTAVNSVNLEVADNTIHALVGPNGAGKTTLFNLLTGFLQPSSGQILLRGDDIAGKQPEQIAHLGVARSFQITSLFDEMTLIEHLELALASPTGLGYKFWTSRKQLGQFKARAMELLDQVGLADRAGVRAGSLAYGQKRALEIALALANDPSLLLLDEPTAGMGLEDVDRTIELVKKVSGGRAVVFVDHNMHVVGSLADRVTVLQSGEVLAEGTYERVRSDERVITAYLGETNDGDGHH
ncbi:amino acid ABC transporter ATP-binding protein [Knoellia subterranea KCTC 19937]|uniref:Amino acid ABC transporter ATP-binding protein n=1 Tax=Knoellia subterranea KCTC 19937 TaxID=1385521 RepID=A0A0A0JSG7_9MICO|nr:amino acid ABC transporter ATP-binding protein [Knoellia subterranea KCTC 19937]